MNNERPVAPTAETAAIESGYKDFYRLACERVQGAQFHEDAELGWAISGGMHPILNAVFATHWAPDLSLEQMREKIQAALAPFRARHVPFVWSVWPSTQPADLGSHLQAWGLVLAHTEPGMSLDLARPLPDMPSVEGLGVDVVRDDEMWDQWLTACSRGFEFSEHDQTTLRPYFWQLGYAEPMRHFLGRLNGEAVATTTLLLRNGVAGIYNVATLPAARRQGLGAALTLAALRYAQSQGYPRAMLLATPSGYPVYRRLGLLECCTVPQYVWVPGSEMI
jgi:ribosomal protein S18 acetylase RimI-like enzyme